MKVRREMNHDKTTHLDRKNDSLHPAVSVKKSVRQSKFGAFLTWKFFACSSSLWLSMLLVGCQSSPQREVGQDSQLQSAPPVARDTKETAMPFVQIYEDEAMLKGSRAIIGGTVENIAGERLEDLSVELELRRRKDQKTEIRVLDIQPQTLAPGERGRYSLALPSNEWSGSRIVRLRSGARAEDIPYKSQVGARRPPERIPETRTRVVVEPRPRPRQKSEEFINTPDNPERIP